MTTIKRMKLSTIREKLLETYKDTYYEIISDDGKIEGYIQYNRGKLIGLSQSLIYLGITSERLDKERNELKVIFHSKQD